MTPNTYTQAEKAARETLDHVAGFARFEALFHGEYATDDLNCDLAETFPICGGHKACLLGSAILGAGIKYGDDSPEFNAALQVMWGDDTALDGTNGEDTAKVLILVREALDAEAEAILKVAAESGNKRASELLAEFANQAYRDSDSLAEAYFEEFLTSEHRDGQRDSTITNVKRETRDAICNLAAAAKERIGLVPA